MSAHTTGSPPESPPRRGSRLRFFTGEEGPAYRRRRQIFGAIWAAVSVGLIVPVIPAVWSPHLLLGLPTSFVWVIACLAVMFSALVWIYRSEDD